ncbi:MAG: permease [Anaerocolumna sp.]
MAVYIDVVTGFLESGKTTFIKELFTKKRKESYEKIILLVCEEGEKEYDLHFLEANHIILYMVEDPKEITDELFDRIEQMEEPDYILVEYNGTWDINPLLNVKIPNYYTFRNIVYVSEAETFFHYLSNMSALLHPHIKNSDYVIFNRFENINNSQKRRYKKQVRNINSNTKPYFLNKPADHKTLFDSFAPGEQFKTLITPGMVIALFIMILLCFLSNEILIRIYQYIQEISVSFLSILIQALPFILLGAFISSLIQVIIPSSRILNIISKHNIKSFIVAAFAGFFFPVCDCGLVPMISGLLKKRAPLPQIMTFWLTSAAVNPIVILSVLYAFPGNPRIAILRVLAGLFTGIMVGVILMILKIKTKDVLNDNLSFQTIGGDFLEVDKESRFYKASAVIKGTQIEFFRVLKYVIIGALVSSVGLLFLPETIQNFIGANVLIQYLIMLIAAMFMSTCSTSNAFIARSFTTSFSYPSILSFMALGPMLDFKNLIIFSETLKKGFLVQICVLTGVIGLITYSLLNLFI